LLISCEQLIAAGREDPLKALRQNVLYFAARACKREQKQPSAMRASGCNKAAANALRATVIY
jgi:hypothetical protein